MKINLVLLFSVLATSLIAAQQSPEQQHAAMMERGEHAMGFSQTETTHHFLLSKQGGTIEVSANDPADTASRSQIRMHLTHIAKMFSAGDFNIPMLVHNTTPPGVDIMAKLGDQIRYRYRNTSAGGKVEIATRNPQALRAIHDFLRFQISEHRTGDPIEPPTNRRIR